MMERVVTIGCVNFATKWGDKEANLDKIKQITEIAAEIGINIIAFPELALSGYMCESKDSCSMHSKLAETIPGPSTNELSAVASKLGIYIIIGMPEKSNSIPDNKCFNSAPVIGPEGILGTYRKLNISHIPMMPETNCFVSGNIIMKELPVFQTKYGPIGVQICYDFWMLPELSRILALKEARIIFNCTASSDSPGRIQLMTQQTGARATENQVYAASANLVGQELNASFFGHSTIAGPSFPRMTHIYAAGGDKEEIVSATLSFDKLYKMRRHNTLFKDRPGYCSKLIIQELQNIESESSDIDGLLGNSTIQ